jgi:TRAP-type mannitol/chloroaromatic compound transport system substrate-binding protein
VLEAACGATLSWTASEAVMQQVKALARFQTMGVEFHQWPDDLLLELRNAWHEVIAEEAAGNPLLESAWSAYLDFHDGYGGWQSRAYVDWAGSTWHSGEPETVKD